MAVARVTFGRGLAVQALVVAFASSSQRDGHAIEGNGSGNQANKQKLPKSRFHGFIVLSVLANRFVISLCPHVFSGLKIAGHLANLLHALGARRALLLGCCAKIPVSATV